MESRQQYKMEGKIGIDEAAPEAGDASKHDRSLVTGIAWTAVTKWMVQALSWASTLIVARLLSPDDFGLVAIAMVYLGFVQLVSEFGLTAAVITDRDLKSHQIAQFNSMSVLLGVAGLCVSLVVATPLADFFSAQEVRVIIFVASASFVVAGLQMVPNALLQKELRFKLLALIDVAKAVAQIICTLVLALLGFQYWALVLGNLLGIVVGTVLTLMNRSHSFAWPRPRQIHSALAFSWHVFVSRLSWYLVSNADFFVVGRVLGKTALGFYSLGWTLATIPVEKITAVVSRVTYPIFASIQTDRAALCRYLLTLTELLSLVIFPVAFGMALVAQDFVILLLGQKWEGAVAPLVILAVSTAVRGIDPLLPQIMFVIGGARLGMIVGMVSVALLPASFYLASRWGLVGIAMVWIVVYPLLLLPIYYYVFSRLKLSTRRYLGALRPALSASLAMILAVLLLGVLTEASSAWLRLVLQVICGAIVYILYCFLFHRDRIRVLYDFVRLGHH